MIWSLEKVDELTDRQIVGQHQQAGNTLIGQFMLSLQIRHLFPEKIGTVLPNTHLRPISRSDRSGNRFCTGGQAHPATPQFSCQHHTHIYSCTARKGGTSCHGFFFTGLYISAYQHIWKYLEIFEIEMETSLGLGLVIVVKRANKWAMKYVMPLSFPHALYSGLSLKNTMRGPEVLPLFN